MVCAPALLAVITRNLDELTVAVTPALAALISPAAVVDRRILGYVDVHCRAPIDCNLHVSA